MKILNFATVLAVSILVIVVSSEVNADGVLSFDLSWQFKKNNEKLEEVCPNNRTKCTNQQTCCITKHGSYHCCRYANAVCCPDKFHCCPEGSTCDTVKKRCQRQSKESIAATEAPKPPIEWPVVEDKSVIEINNQVCPNNRTKCQDSQTCCVTKHGSYHCCKYKNAVCCPDKFHCCPEDSTCDTRRHRCVKSYDRISRLKPSNTLFAKEQISNGQEPQNGELLDQTCPNNKTKCKDTKTCCITKHGNYYCCPHKNAVCCSDKWQCCPEGTTCDLKNKKCINSFDKSFVLVTYQSKVAIKESENIQELDITCPNNKTKCKDTKTCCVTKHNNYYCCPHKNAVCCSDKWQCCPEGTTCDLKNKKCISSVYRKFVVNTFQSNVVKEESGEIVKLDATCPNNKTKCKDTKTCCITKHGNYYCCPHKNAVCCSDKWQCCPEGTTCDLKNKKCISSSNSFDSNTSSDDFNEPALLNPSQIELLNVFSPESSLGKQCPNSHTAKCAGHERCCVMDGGKFGCCTYKNGVCCPDLKTCCPHGTECDGKTNKCTSTSKALVIIPTKPLIDRTRLKTTLCPDNKSECPSWETCCLADGDIYGCCPYENATCCADKVNCCPQDQKCDLKQNICVSYESPKSMKLHFSVERKSLISFYSVIGMEITCSDKSKCPNDHSCCSIGNDANGCCPYSSGVCCSDLQTCCPNGKKCGINGCF